MSYKTIDVARYCKETIILCDNPDCGGTFILTIHREWEDSDYGPQEQTYAQCCCKFCPYCGKEIKPIDLDKEKENGKPLAE